MKASAGLSNRRIVVIAEGDTERAARNHLKEFLDARAGSLPRVRLHVAKLDGGLAERRVRDLADRHLREEGTLGVVALSDLYPRYRDAADAKRVIASWMPIDPRCHVHVAKHDFEAWLLADWRAVLRQAGVEGRQPWGAKPEEIDVDRPPAHRLRELFAHGGRSSYKKTVDGKKLFEALDLEAAAGQCPELRSFLNCLLALAGYPVLA
ncbi:MAG: DUF4276 family protein [Deltaproteobacteria bacterium]|nr:DUF4276 family protein [Deltaproteobacteria bacterium]